MGCRLVLGCHTNGDSKTLYNHGELLMKSDLEAWIRFQFFGQIYKNGRWRKARFSRHAKIIFGVPKSSQHNSPTVRKIE